MASLTDLLGSAGDTITTGLNSVTGVAKSTLDTLSSVVGTVTGTSTDNNTAAGTATSGATVRSVVIDDKTTKYLLIGGAVLAAMILLRK